MWPLFIVCLALVIAKQYLQWRSSKSKRVPPGPPGLPLIGNILDVSRLVKKTKLHAGAWCQLAKIYGPIVRLRFGMSKPILVISGRKAVMEVLSRREFDGRPQSFRMKSKTFGLPRGVTFSDGPAWTERKRFLLTVLKDFGFCKQAMEDLIMENATSFIKNVEEKVTDAGFQTNDFCALASIAVINSLWQIVANVRYDMSEEQPKLFKIMEMISELFRSNRTTSSVNVLWDHIPGLRYIIPRFSKSADDSENITYIWDFFQEEVTKHKNTRISGVCRDLIDAYLDQIDAQASMDNPSFDELHLVATIKDLFIAGVETTSHVIGFSIIYLAKYPDIQSKVHAELDQIIGKDELPRLAMKTSLPYLNATIAEVMRISNVAPTTVVHRTTSDCSLFDYDISANTLLLMNLLSIHMDVDHWKDPEVFRPERFIDTSGKYIEDPWLIPFGAGRRKCLGETLARNSLLLFLACLLQRFKFCLTSDDNAAPLVGIDGFTLSPPEVKFLVVKRQ